MCITTGHLGIAQKVDEAPWSRDDDFGLSAKVELLFAEGHATNNAAAAHISEFTEN
jgi:hypothetical protein